MAFIYKYPVYVIGIDLLTNPNGEQIVGEGTKLVSVDVSEKQHLAVFTSLDLAQAYFQEVPQPAGYVVCPLPNSEFITVVLNAPEEIHGIVVDPSPRTLLGTPVEKEEMISDLMQELRREVMERW